MPVDIHFNHLSEIFSLRACRCPDATDLIAIGGENSVQVIQVYDTHCEPIASFRVGTRITALAWSSRAVSPSASKTWFLELVAATADFGLHLLTKSPKDSEYVYPFGGGISGHHGTITGMTFCGGYDEDSARYVATVAEDKMLMIWDLYPTVDIPSATHNNLNGNDADDDLMSSPFSSRTQPTAYVIPFPHALTSIASHPSTTKEFLVADSRGSVFITDWRTDPNEADEGSQRHTSVMELTEPSGLASAIMNENKQYATAVDWRVDTTDLIGGVFGSRFAIWDISKLAGGTPHLTASSFPEGGQRFRWCPTLSEYFAISTQSPSKGAILHVHNYTYAHAPPTSLQLRPKPHFIRDFDFLALKGIPRIAAAVGHEVIIFQIGEDA